MLAAEVMQKSSDTFCKAGLWIQAARLGLEQEVLASGGREDPVHRVRGVRPVPAAAV